MSGDKDDNPNKGSRRHRKGDYQGPQVVPPIVPDPIARQIPAEDFSALLARAEAFAHRRFGPILPQIGAAFFKGRTEQEVRDEGLQAAGAEADARCWATNRSSGWGISIGVVKT